MNIREEDFRLVIEDDPEFPSYLEQEEFEKEYEDWNNGIIAAYSVYASVEFKIPINHYRGDKKSMTIAHKVRSPGLHSVMLYTYPHKPPEEDAYVREIFIQESDILIEMLIGMGIGVQRNFNRADGLQL